MKNFLAPWVGLLAVSFTLWLGACSPVPQPAPAPQPAQVAAPAPQSVIVEAAPAQAPSNDGFLTGMLMGHLLSGGGGYVHAPTGVQHTTVVNKTVNVNRAPPRPAYRPVRSYRPTYRRR